MLLHVNGPDDRVGVNFDGHPPRIVQRGDEDVGGPRLRRKRVVKLEIVAC